ncbi:MAG: helix-turn-helix transcriptional regulator [Polyangiaceae bacterium]
MGRGAQPALAPADTLASYATEPVGRYVSGRTWVHFTSRDGLAGFAIWGRPDVDEVVRLTQAMATELPSRTPPHVVLDDLRRLEHAEPRAFDVFSRFIAEHNAEFVANVTKQAVLRPSGVLGAIVAGFFDIVKPLGETRVMTDSAQAFAWLGRPMDPLASELDDLYEAALGLPPIVRRVREFLEARRGRATIGDLARSLAMSERSLQQHLKRAGTSFRAEAGLARVSVAKQLLARSDAALTEIAFDVGCASLQHFSTLFRKTTGETPSAYRARVRG